MVLKAVNSFVLCTPVTEGVLLALPVEDDEDLTEIDFADVERATIRDRVLWLVVSSTEEVLDFGGDEIEELLLLRLVDLEELDEAKAEVNDSEEETEANEEAPVTEESPLSGEFQGPERTGSDNVVTPGESHGPCIMGMAGRAVTDARRMTRQYTSSILIMVTCNQPGIGKGKHTGC